jgi:hypothetical protein
MAEFDLATFNKDNKLLIWFMKEQNNFRAFSSKKLRFKSCC